jgi:16S rRNA processing protein RimM
MPGGLVAMGVIGRPHGVRGLVRVTSFTAEPADLASYPLQDERGRRFALEWRGEGIAAIGERAGGETRWVRDRDAAARLTNVRLYAPREALPPPEDDEFYLTDLVGMAAFDAAGKPLGTVAAVHDYGAGASLEIGALLVPFTRACVPEVDVAARRLTVVPPAEVAGEQT